MCGGRHQLAESGSRGFRADSPPDTPAGDTSMVTINEACRSIKIANPALCTALYILCKLFKKTY